MTWIQKRSHFELAVAAPDNTYVLLSILDAHEILTGLPSNTKSNSTQSTTLCIYICTPYTIYYNCLCVDKYTSNRNLDICNLGKCGSKIHNLAIFLLDYLKTVEIQTWKLWISWKIWNNWHLGNIIRSKSIISLYPVKFGKYSHVLHLNCNFTYVESAAFESLFESHFYTYSTYIQCSVLWPKYIFFQMIRKTIQTFFWPEK